VDQLPTYSITDWQTNRVDSESLASWKSSKLLRYHDKIWFPTLLRFMRTRIKRYRSMVLSLLHFTFVTEWNRTAPLPLWRSMLWIQRGQIADNLSSHAAPLWHGTDYISTCQPQVQYIPVCVVNSQWCTTAMGHTWCLVFKIGCVVSHIYMLLFTPVDLCARKCRNYEFFLDYCFAINILLLCMHFHKLSNAPSSDLVDCVTIEKI